MPPTKLSPVETTRTYTDRDGRVLVTLWKNGRVDVQSRRNAKSEWSMPIRCHEETDIAPTVRRGR